MTQQRPTIAIIGAGFPLALTAYHLAKKLKALKPIILALELEEDQAQPEIQFAFPPFAEASLPTLKKNLAAHPAQVIKLNTQQGDFNFNFSSYGVASSSITFPQAYEVYAKTATYPKPYDAFLNTSNTGYSYSNTENGNIYKQQAVASGVLFIPTQHPNIELTADKKSIAKLITSSQQAITADLFIDCSSSFKLMASLQSKVDINPENIPKWDMEKLCASTTNPQKDARISFTDKNITLSAGYQNNTYTTAYHFSPEAKTAPCYFQSPWQANCIALGSAFLNVPELLVSHNQLLELQLTLLQELIGVNTNNHASQQFFNGRSNKYAAEAIDSINLLLSANLKNITLNRSNKQQVELFSSSANTRKTDRYLLNDGCWAGLFHATNNKPMALSALAAASNAERVTELAASLLKKQQD
ncbi:MAG: hypothetical protein U5M23_00990 [Marinagarivorans sp.]|nr:hypothetical protein [Marinagarivorans sp.]